MYEVSSSNHDLHKCAYFVKKLYLGSRGAACGGGQLAGIFYSTLFCCFRVFSISFFYKLICMGGSWHRPYISIFSCDKGGCDIRP